MHVPGIFWEQRKLVCQAQNPLHYSLGVRPWTSYLTSPTPPFPLLALHSWIACADEIKPHV